MSFSDFTVMDLDAPAMVYRILDGINSENTEIKNKEIRELELSKNQLSENYKSLERVVERMELELVTTQEYYALCKRESDKMRETIDKLIEEGNSTSTHHDKELAKKDKEIAELKKIVRKDRQRKNMFAQVSLHFQARLKEEQTRSELLIKEKEAVKTKLKASEKEIDRQVERFVRLNDEKTLHSNAVLSIKRELANAENRIKEVEEQLKEEKQKAVIQVRLDDDEESSNTLHELIEDELDNTLEKMGI